MFTSFGFCSIEIAELCYAMGDRYLLGGKIMANGGSRQWMPPVGGALNIMSGVSGLIIGLPAGIFAIVFQTTHPVFKIENQDAMPLIIAICWVSCAVTLIPGIISIVGGVFAIKRKSWGWALAGSICSLPSVPGIFALVFIIMGRKEFSRQGDNA